MRIATILVILACITYQCVNPDPETSPAPQGMPLTIQTVTDFERKPGPYQIIRDRTLKLKLRYEVEQILSE